MSNIPIEDQRRIIQLEEDGWPIRAICREVKHSYGAVRNVLDSVGSYGRHKIASFNLSDKSITEAIIDDMNQANKHYKEITDKNKTTCKYLNITFIQLWQELFNYNNGCEQCLISFEVKHFYYNVEVSNYYGSLFR